MARFNFAVSATLAAVGTALGVFGILAEECKPIAIGMIMIFGGGVFALLYVGTRPRIARSSPERTTGP